MIFPMKMKTLFQLLFGADNDDLPEKLITHISHLLNFLSFYQKKTQRGIKETVAASRTVKKEIMGFK